MPRICHIFDESTGWEQRVAVNQLIDRLPSDRFTHDLVAIEPRAVRVLSTSRNLRALTATEATGPDDRGAAHPSITLCARRLGINISASISLRAHFEKSMPDLIHAWGANAAVAARAASDVPMVVSLFDPVLATRYVKALRTLVRQSEASKSSFDSGGASPSPHSGDVAVACSCEIVHRRLVEGGWDEKQTVVIRPGIEFARINAAVRSGLRERLGITRDETVVIVPFGGTSDQSPSHAFSFLRRSAASHDTGHFDAAWAVTLLKRVHGGYRIILPKSSAETRSITRFVEGLPVASPIVYVDDGPTGKFAGVAPFEDLLAISDVLVVPVRGDISTTAIAWAMASKTAVIGSAVYAVAELLANKVNGLLFKPPRGKSMAVTITKLVRDDASLAKVRETARGQAYEVFGLRRCITDYRRLYANLLSNQAPGSGIADPAYAV